MIANASVKIIPALSPVHVTQAQELFREYAATVGVDLCFQNFAHELAGLPGSYAPPEGALLLAFHEGELAGCVAVRNLGEGACEMKRLFLRPRFRGKKLGRHLALAAIEQARQIGYLRIRLDTLPSMENAITMYRSLGFTEIGPYTANPVIGALFMELSLR